MNLELVAAKVVLDITDADEIIEAALDSLEDLLGPEADRESASLIELAISTDLSCPEAGTLLQRSFRELGMPWPTYDDAGMCLIRFWLTEISEERISPRDGMEIVYYDIFSLVNKRWPDKRYVGDGVGLALLFGVYHSYDDVAATPPTNGEPATSKEDAIREIDHRVLELSREWLATHAGGVSEQ